MTLLNTRTTARDITTLFTQHAQKIVRGEVARVQVKHYILTRTLIKNSGDKRRIFLILLFESSNKECKK